MHLIDKKELKLNQPRFLGEVLAGLEGLAPKAYRKPEGGIDYLRLALPAYCILAILGSLAKWTFSAKYEAVFPIWM